MSNNLPPLPGEGRRPKLSSFFGSSPTISAFQSRSSARPELDVYGGLERKTPGRIGELAGLPSQEFERISAKPEYDALMTSAAVLGDDIATEPPKGSVMSFLEFIDRPRSAIVGGLTGLLGKTRESDVREGLGAEGTNGDIFRTAKRRFVEGITGDDRFYMSDFGTFGKRPTRDDSLLSRGFNSIGGFVIDTVLDPITYLSFGGSIFGRKTGSELITAVSSNASDSQKIIKSWSDNLDPITTIKRGINDNSHKYEEVINKIVDLMTSKGYDSSLLPKVTDDFDVILSSTDDDILRGVAHWMMPTMIGTSVGAGGTKQARRLLDDLVGDQVQIEAYIDSLPADLRGGIRIRLPFYRAADGTPKAWAIPGTGFGRASQKSQAIDFITTLTEAGRKRIASFGPVNATLSALGGQNGRIYYNAIAAARGRVEKNGAVSYNAYLTMQQSRNVAARLGTLFDNEVSLKYQELEKTYEDMLSKFGDNAKAREAFEEVHRIFENRLHLIKYGQDKLDDIRKSKVISEEDIKLATETGTTVFQILDDIKDRAIDAYKDSELAFHALKYYIPRTMTDDAMNLRRIHSKGLGQGSSAGWKKKRTRLFDLLTVDEKGGIKVLTWYDPKTVNTIMATDEWGEFYMTDFRQWLPLYIYETRSALRDQSLVNFFKSSGIMSRASRQEMERRNESVIVERFARLGGVSAGDEAEDAALDGTLRGWRERMESDKEYFGSLNLESINELDVASRRLYDFLSDDMGLSGRVPNRSELDEYIETAKDSGVFINRWDKSRIVKNEDGSFSSLDSNGENLFSDDFEKFATLDLAVATTASLKNQERSNNYLTVLLEIRQNYELIIDETLASDIMLRLAPGESVPEGIAAFRAFDLSDVPDSEKAERMQDILGRMEEVLYKFNLTDGIAQRDARGRLIVTEPSTVSSREDVTDEFLKLIRDRELVSITGAGLAGDTANISDAVRNRVIKEFEDFYGQRILVEGMSKLFESKRRPENAAQEIYENFYRPFYAVQKVWMTLGRGPGFAVKNFLGGSFNAFSGNVGRQDADIAAKVIIAKLKAVKHVEENLGKGFWRDSPVEAQNMMQTKMMELLKDEPGGYELYDMFLKNALDAGRESASVVSQLMEGARSRITSPGRIRRGSQVIRDYAGGAELVDAGVMDIFQSALIDNPWIRSMQNVNSYVEDYLRLASFAKGVRTIGLEPAESGIQGYGASLFVKGTQFDYDDLSDFERGLLKNVFPFYTWTRYNVPLQIRNIIHNPGRIASVVRGQGEMAVLFGEAGDPEGYPYASYLKERFSYVIPKEQFEFLPDWLEPEGDVSMGMVWGEPLTDVNRLFRAPTSASRGQLGLRVGEAINLRDIVQNLNPNLALFGGMATAKNDPGVEPGLTEKAMGWTRFIHFGRYDDNTGDPIVSRALADSIRNIFPFVGQLERNIPQVFGGERQQGRQFTSLLSSFAGLPVATEDSWKTIGAMEQRSNLVRRQLQREFGEFSEYRVKAVRDLLDAGAPVSFIESLNLGELADNQIDTAAFVSLWQLIDRSRKLRAAGIPEEDLIAALSVYMPEGAPVPGSIEEAIYRYLPLDRTDFASGTNVYSLQPLSEEQLASIGLDQEDVLDMTTEERMALIVYFNNRMSR